MPAGVVSELMVCLSDQIRSILAAPSTLAEVQVWVSGRMWTRSNEILVFNIGVEYSRCEVLLLPIFVHCGFCDGPLPKFKRSRTFTPNELRNKESCPRTTSARRTRPCSGTSWIVRNLLRQKRVHNTHTTRGGAGGWGGSNRSDLI